MPEEIKTNRDAMEALRATLAKGKTEGDAVKLVEQWKADLAVSDRSGHEMAVCALQHIAKRRMKPIIKALAAAKERGTSTHKRLLTWLYAMTGAGWVDDQQNFKWSPEGKGSFLTWDKKEGRVKIKRGTTEEDIAAKLDLLHANAMNWNTPAFSGGGTRKEDPAKNVKAVLRSVKKMSDDEFLALPDSAMSGAPADISVQLAARVLAYYAEHQPK